MLTVIDTDQDGIHHVRNYPFTEDEPMTLTSGAGTGRTGNQRTEAEMIVFQQNQRNEVRDLAGIAGAIPAQPGMKQQNYIAGAISSKWAKGSGGPSGAAPLTARHGAVRRLTPTECERLQGFEDGWTADQADSTRYRQLGNAVAVPAIEWIGRRIIKVLEIDNEPG